MNDSPVKKSPFDTRLSYTCWSSLHPISIVPSQPHLSCSVTSAIPSLPPVLLIRLPPPFPSRAKRIASPPFAFLLFNGSVSKKTFPFYSRRFHTKVFFPTFASLPKEESGVPPYFLFGGAFHHQWRMTRNSPPHGRCSSRRPLISGGV